MECINVNVPLWLVFVFNDVSNPRKTKWNMTRTTEEPEASVN